MARARRTKRASATDLYKTCKANNTCPPDVINKVEGTTVADRILQIGAATVYFGGLGIGTGAGKGGATGYTPLGGRTGVTVGTGTRVSRPPIPVDSLGASEIVPVDALSPAIVPLQEVPPDIPLLEVTPDIPGIPEPPSVVPIDSSVSSAGGPVQIEVTAIIEPIPSNPPVRTSTSWSQHSNPAFDVLPNSDHVLGETSSPSSILVTHSNGGVDIGATEEIPLRVFRTSTPRDTPVREPVPRRGGYPARFIEHVDVSGSEFLDNVGRMVQFEFENPTFEDDTLTFEPPPYPEVRAAPDSRFRDVVQLSRPLFEETPSGHVRVTRKGVRGTITTRSGVQLGSQVHFHHDISSITEPEWIELSALGEVSGTTVVVSQGPEAAMEVIDLDSISTLSSHSSDFEMLLAGIEDVHNFDNLRLEFPRGRNRVTLDLPTRTLTIPGPVDLDTGVHVDYTPPDAGGGMYGPFGPAPAVIIVDVSVGSSTDYYLHPSLARRRRRRRRRRSL
ncbi:L2 [Chipapillomavirus 2]|nr:L2 [Chipapillomavirus 2]